MNKLTTLFILIISTLHVYGKGGVHIKGCKVKCATHAKLAFPKGSTTSTTTDGTRRKKDPKPADWPWWLAY